MTTMSGHACPKCEGNTTVRIKGRPGWERFPCQECGGAGTHRPGPRRKEDR